jgi:hypothetical protein
VQGGSQLQLTVLVVGGRFLCCSLHNVDIFALCASPLAEYEVDHLQGRGCWHYLFCPSLWDAVVISDVPEASDSLVLAAP